MSKGVRPFPSDSNIALEASTKKMRLSRPENLWSSTERGKTALAAAPPPVEPPKQAAGPELPSERG